MCRNHTGKKVDSGNLIPNNFSDRPTQKCASFLKKGTVGQVTGNENIIDDCPMLQNNKTFGNRIVRGHSHTNFSHARR